MPAVAVNSIPSGAARLDVEAAIAAALAQLGAGQAAPAIERLRSVDPAGANAAHCNLIGRVLVAAGAQEPALAWFERALVLEPAFGEALLNRAGILVALGRPDAALAAYWEADRVGVRDAVACYNQGALLRDRAAFDDALTAFERALQLRPAYPEALRAAGLVHRILGHSAEALAMVDAALRLSPGDVEACVERANLLRDQDRLVEAFTTLEAGLRAQAGNARLLNNRGILLHDLGRMAEALASLDAALEADPASAQAQHNRGNVLIRLGRHADAVAAFDAALELDPAHAEARASRGVALKMLGRFDEALQSFEAALACDPGSIHGRANRGELRLLRGDFASGWPDYEFRFFTERQTKPMLTTPVPPWDGGAHPGARIVVLADQGNGDTIQFARFLPQLRDTGAAVIFVCPPRLQRVLRPVTDGIEVRSAVDDDEAFDFQIALSSMPGAFRTDLASLAGSSPYLRAEPDLTRLWGQQLGSQGPKVGLCWRGSQNWQCDPNRSVPLAALASLAGIPDLRLFSLQMPDNAEQNGAAVPLEDLSARLDNGADGFVDTAAVMANLDLVVTCDTSIAHLAGALGRPCWVLLQLIPEWRWMLERPTSPWYPTMQLFRQRRAGDWTAPVEELAEALRRGDHRG